MKINNRFSLITPRLIKQKPLFLMRTGFRTIFKTNKLRSILFHSHYKCNLNCSHCYEKNFLKTNKKILSLEEQKNIIKECLKLGVVSFDFVSGESVLNSNLPELIKACKPYKTYITIATNGYGFTEEKIKNLLDIGVDKLNISIDSFYSEEHDKIRQKRGVHKAAFETIEFCKKVGMGFHITIFVYKNSIQTNGFKKLIDYAMKNNIRIALKLAIPLGQWEAKHNMLITKNDRKVVDELCKKHPTLIKICDKGNRKGGCPAFDEVITITAYGDILPCNGIHISFGNIREDNLKNIIEKGRKIKYFNGKYKGCPPAEDMNFIKNYLSKTYKANPYPIKAGEVFELM